MEVALPRLLTRCYAAVCKSSGLALVRRRCAGGGGGDGELLSLV